ncbi:glycoprotein [Kolongo virus]|uniref:Glycoprotein n=1 Tax=Kolongo virus TaxID=380436 RepID=A0AAE9BMG2_9RHAB|nr:glycoprotein [Kolongo virus]UAU42884.1 glycoprotein [Kolongo virus]WAD86861.1 glycoprotein [Kolongo virus]
MILIKIFSIVVITLFTFGSGKESIYFPVEIKEEGFQEIPLKKLKCPYDIDDADLINPVRFNGKILVRNQIDVQGRVCYKHQITAKCSENFWGKQDYTHDVKHLNIGKEEVDSTHQNDAFLAPDVKCQWMSDTDSTVIKIFCDPLVIKYDESLQVGYTPAFGGFKCDAEKCRIDAHHVFLLDKNRTLTKGYKAAVLEFSTSDKKTVDQNSLVKSNYFPKTSLIGACVSGDEISGQMSYKIITRNGLLIELDHNAVKHGKAFNKGSIHGTHSSNDIKNLIGKKFEKGGVWGQTMFSDDGRASYTLSDDSLDTFHKMFHRILVELRLCQKNDFERVRVPTLDYERVMTEMFVESKLDQIECKRNLYKIMTTKKITNSDLSMLAQNHHGPGVVYKISQGKLLAAHGAYKKIIWSPKGDRLGLDFENNQTVNCPSWEKDPENPDVEWCVNGIFRRNNLVYHPVFGGDNIDDLRLIFDEKILRNVEHLSLINVQKNTWEEHYNLTSSTKFKGFDINFDFLKNFESNIIHWVVVGFSVIIGLLLISKCVSRRRRDHFIP